MKYPLSMAILFVTILFMQPTQAVFAAESDGRFTMTPTDGGFLRLDTQTGAVALCARKDDAWSCNAVKDGQLPAQEQIATLTKENQELKSEIEDARRVLDAQIATSKPSSSRGPGIKIPSDGDIDKMMDALEKVIRRFKGMVNELKEERVPGTPL